jgi:putative redox protein
MKVKVCHLGKTRFQIQARQHIIESDQPVENGGDDAAMTPPELFLASLGSCAAFYAAQFLSSRQLADHGLEVSVDAEKLRDPARLGNFVIKVQSPVSLTVDQTLAMERSVHHCLIHQTMLQPAQIAIEILAREEMPALA